MVATGSTSDSPRDGWQTYRYLMRNRSVRLLGLLSIALAAGFYAQFETGLTAFALQSLSVEPTVVGTAAAVNCVVIVGLQWLVVRLTGDRDGAGLLVVVGAIWVGSWLLLEAALFVSPHVASALFVVAFAIFAVGETMYAPILSPLTAAVAPPGLVGTTLGALAALRTGISAVGPLVAGALLAFALSLDEIIVTTFTIGNEQTLPIWIFANYARPNQLPIVNVVGLLVILLSIIPVYFANKLSQDPVGVPGGGAAAAGAR